MDVKQAYNLWADQYDTNNNKTRDLEAASLRSSLANIRLVLEHIENLDDIFHKASKVTRPNGCVYTGELHPFKQYTGSKARFDTGEGLQTVTCFNHHVSDFSTSAKNHGFEVVDIAEFFDENDRSGLPRILTFLFRKIA